MFSAVCSLLQDTILEPLIVVLAPFGLRPKATLSRRALPLLAPLVERGYRVHILAPADLWPADAGVRLDVAGITIEHAPLATRSGIAGMFQTTRWMYQRTQALQPALVHLFKPKGYGALATLALLRTKPQLPMVLDTDDWEGRGGWNDQLPYAWHIKLLINWLEETLPQRVDAVTVASLTLHIQTVMFGASLQRVNYIPNGVTVPGRALSTRDQARHLLQLDQRPTILLYTRFWEFDVRDVVTCLIAVACHIPNIRLLVIGAGERGEEELLALYAQRAGVAHLIDNRGWADESTIAAGLAAADLALYPMHDTLINRAKCSAKLAEQMQAGLPIVAARVGQVSEYIEHEHSGWLVRPGDGGALAQGVLHMLQNPEYARQLGRAAHMRIEHLFAWDKLAMRLEQVYTQLVAKGASDGRVAS